MKKSPFQRQVDKDFLTTFLCDKEYGRVCDWNGGQLRITEFVLNDNPSEEAPGVLQTTKKIICRDRDLPKLPEPGDTVYLDGDAWIVFDAYRSLGHFTIFLNKADSQ